MFKRRFWFLPLCLFLLPLTSCGFTAGSSSSSSVHQHTYSDAWTSDEAYHWHDATCGHDVRSEVGRHQFTSRTVEPTFEEPGKIVYTCTVCQYSYEEEGDPVKEHTYSTEWTGDAEGHYHVCVDKGYEHLTEDFQSHYFSEWVTDVEPTAITAGRRHASCDVCGYRLTQAIESDADYSKRVLRFELNPDGKSYKTVDGDIWDYGYSSQSECYLAPYRRLIIPESYNGLPVTVIGKGSLYDARAYTVVIPSTVTTIEADGLYNDFFTHLVIPSTVKTCDFTNQGVDARNVREVLAPASLIPEVEMEVAFITSPSQSKIRVEGDFVFYGDELALYTGTAFSVTVPTGAKVIGERAFDNRKTLNEVTLPEGVESIESFAFYGCNYLYKLHLPSTFREWNDDDFGKNLWEIALNPANKYFVYENGLVYSKDKTKLFYVEKGVEGDIVLPSSLREIAKYAFWYCERIRSIRFSSGMVLASYPDIMNCCSLEEVPGIGDVRLSEDAEDTRFGCFYYCYRLKEIEIPAMATRPGGFLYCSSLEKVTFRGNAIIDFYGRPFAGCSSLRSILIPEGVKSIDSYAFAGCSKLSSVSIPSTVEKIGADAFANCAFTSFDFPLTKEMMTTTFLSGNPITSFTIPEGTTSIPDAFFSHCEKLTSITIPDSVTSIGDEAFAFCLSLKDITFGTGLKTIGECAFRYCYQLESLHIPEGVTVIGEGAFSQCYGLRHLYLPSTLESFGTEGEMYSVGSLLSFVNASSLPIVIEDDRQHVIPELVRETSVDLRGFRYYLENGHKVLCRYEGQEKDIVVPSEYTHLADGVFQLNDTIETVRLAEGTEVLPNFAFCECANLREVYLPDSLLRIEDEALRSSIPQVTIPKNVTYVSEVAFGYHKSVINLSSVDLGPYVTPDSEDTGFRMDGYFATRNDGDGRELVGYYGNEERIVVPEGVTSIAYDAFETRGLFAGLNTKAKTLVLPSTFERFYYAPGWWCSGDDALWALEALERIEVSASNPRYTSIDGILYSKDKTELVRCPRAHVGETVTFPSTLRSIGDHAFDAVDTLRSLNIPDQVDTIGVCAFSECRNLCSIHLPAALTKVDDLVLDECNSLFEIDIPEKVTTIMRDVFTNIYPAVFTFGKNLTEMGSIPSAQKYVFRDTVAELAVRASALHIGDRHMPVFCSDGIWTEYGCQY